MTAPLRIAFLTHGWSPDPGGVETHTEGLARTLVERGHSVRALCLDTVAEREPFTIRADPEDPAGAVAGSVARMAYRYHDHRRLMDLVDRPVSEQAVLDWLDRAPTDLLHVHHLTGWGTGILGRLRRERPDLRVVVSLHDYWTLCPRGQMFDTDGELVERPEAERCGRCLRQTWPHLSPDAEAAAERTEFALRSLTHADALALPSQAALEVFARAGVPRGAMRVIEYGIEGEALARATATERARRAPRPMVPVGPADGFALGFLGSVLPSKGPLELARAVVEAGLPGLRLEVHGPQPSWHGDRSYVEALRALAASDDRIRLHGTYDRSALAGILAGLDAVAVPSLWAETYGLVAREARAVGLPVLVSDRGGLSQVGSQAGRDPAGWSVLDPRDGKAWGRALRDLVEGGAASSRSGDRVGGGFRPLGAMVDELEALYRERMAAWGSSRSASERIGAFRALEDRGECVESPAS